MNKGFISLIIVIVIGLALLYYFFEWSIFDFARSEEGQGTVTYTKQVLNFIWDLISPIFTFLWEEVLKPFFGTLRRE